uniref:Uncharacterized protein n=1 Tax=Hyaloperonospora arabidopsidis (strain Emoy2) TaxID=559515 RepID=M4BKP1_HYAAE
MPVVTRFRGIHYEYRLMLTTNVAELALVGNLSVVWNGWRACVAKQLSIVKFKRIMHLLLPGGAPRPSEAQSLLTLIQEEQNTVQVQCSSCSIDWRLGL